MGLKKQITLNNGIVVNYHRIISLNKITNQYNVIELGSYLSQEARQEEQNKLETGLETQEAVPMNIFIESNYLTIPYDEQMTIEQAYDYLKNLDDFKGAIDV